ncbi:MAG: M23 family metallopeptidase [Calditrichaceae bacterium]|nr:M23 family metallopeptidase [Calditrichaceae bacterium]MBN2707816.1 M23 family metallopeptidase [Calditrichaceae bacterium]
MNKSLLFLFLLYISLSGQQYLWPTSASYALTSSFCEYRPGHYHAAIDIKTWNREGYPIYAVEDGSIYRVWVSPFGYGKVLYLQMKDGQRAVYAHLQKFNKLIERRVFEHQLKNKRYTVQFYPNEIHVKKGDVIGYTGKTGIGSPHLHFEIRDSRDRPVNPLFYYNQVTDNIPPIIQSLMVIPAGRASTVNGSYLPKSYSVIKKNHNNYYLKDAIPVNGRVGLAFECYDMADGVYNKYAHYKAELYVEEHKVFHSQYDILDYDLTSLVDIDIYFPAKAWFNRVYNKLYIEPFNKLEFYDRSLGNGIIQSDSIKNFTLIVSDFKGNKSYLHGRLQADIHLNLQMSVLKQIDSSIILSVCLPNKIKELTFSGFSKDKSWQNLDYFEFLKPLQAANRYNTLIKAKTGKGNMDSLMCTVVDHAGKTGKVKVALQNAVNDCQGNYSITNTGRALVVQGRNINYKHGMFLSCKNRFVNHRIQPVFRDNRFESVIGADNFQDDTLRVLFGINSKAYLDTTIHLKSFYPDSAMSYSAFNGEVVFDAGAGTFYDTMLVSFNRIPTDSVADKTVVLSPMICMTSNPQVFRNKAQLTVKLRDHSFNERQIGIYEPQLNGKWEFSSGQIDNLNNTISFKINKIGNYIAAADTIPPLIDFLPLSVKQPSDKQPWLHLTAVDKQSGIGSDKNILITIDDQFVIPEWDYEEDKIKCRSYWPLAKGEHVLKALISDQCGNTTKKIFKFILN